jgi:hypothetical protein
MGTIRGLNSERHRRRCGHRVFRALVTQHHLVKARVQARRSGAL